MEHAAGWFGHWNGIPLVLSFLFSVYHGGVARVVDPAGQDT